MVFDPYVIISLTNKRQDDNVFLDSCLYDLFFFANYF